MSATPPPYRQLSILLDFLKEALRGDPILAQYMEPGQIVNTVMEHDPFAVQDEDMVRVLDTELPLLACWEISSTPRRRQRRNGEDVSLGLAYIFQIYHGSADLSPQAWAQRVSKLVWWRLNHYLRRGRFDADDNPFNLMTDAGIDDIDAGRATRMGSREHEGILATLSMTHYEPPFNEHEFTKLKTVDFEQHPGTVVPSTTGVITEGLINVDSSD